MRVARRTIVWLAPDQVPLVRSVADAAGLSIVGVGSPERGRAGGLAEQLGVAAVTGPGRDDLRAALATADAELFWIADPGTAEEADADAVAIRGLVSRGVRLATLEPFPAAAPALAEAAWIDGSFGPAPIESVRLVPGILDSTPLRQSEELLSALGPPRLVTVEIWSGPWEGSLGAKLYAAMDAVRRLVGEPESIDAVYVGPGRGPGLHATPGESLRGLHGDITASLRFAGGRAGALILSDQAPGWERSVTLVGPGGRMRVSDDAVLWIGSDGRVQPEVGTGGRTSTDPATAAIAEGIGQVVGAPGSGGGTRGAAQTLALCHAALLSCRTGQAESPGTIRRIAGME